LNVPSIEDQISFYDERWSRDEYINRLALKRLAALLRRIAQIRFEQPPRIIDIGAGRGWQSIILAQIGPTTGIELSGEAVRKAAETYPMVEFRAGDVFEQLHEREHYDLAVSQEVFEHIEDQAAFCALVADALKPGGYFVFTTPNGWVQAHRTEAEHQKWGLQPVEIWRTASELRQLLSARFEVLHVDSVVEGFGTTGVFRFTNSYRLRRILRAVGLERPYLELLMKLGFGLHLVVTARRTA
jgi:2-polyprenyl-3-methyl-5-hydroxy-6-metoxy-1,4-benzoquinol methylase